MIADVWTMLERLMLVQDAQDQFIALSAVECYLEQASVADRIYRDVAAVEENSYFGRSNVYRPGGMDD